MTNQPQPIRKSSLPTTPPPEWEFFTFFPYPDDDGGDMVRGQRQRGVQVRRLVTYGDWEPVRPDRWADEPEPAAVSAAVTPPTDRAAVLREAADRIDNEELPHDYVDMFDNGARWAARLLRRMADETATETPEPDSTTLLELVRDFLDPDPCSFDHHGYCQAHAAGFGGEPLSCPHGRARKLLADLEQPAAGARQDGAET